MLIPEVYELEEVIQTMQQFEVIAAVPGHIVHVLAGLNPAPLVQPEGAAFILLPKEVTVVLL